MELPFKFPVWLYSEITFLFINRWKDWGKHWDYYCIWFGMNFIVGDEYKNIYNVYTFDVTICNFSFKVRFRGNPARVAYYNDKG